MPSASERHRVRRAPDERDELRRSIVDAVRALHHEGGIDAVTMRGVAQAVGLPPMSLYRYYATRNDLVRTLWDEVLAKAFHVSSRAAVGDKPAVRLRGFLGAYIDYWFAHEDDYWLVFGLRDRPRLDGTAGDAMAAFRSHFDLLARRCLPPDLDDARLARIHDLVCARVIGLLHVGIALGHRGPLGRAGCRDLLLDDIEASFAAWAADQRCI